MSVARRANGVSDTAGARIAIVSGIAVRHDAISNIIRRQHRTLTDAGHHVDVIVQHHDDAAPEGTCLAHSSWALQCHPAYLGADLVIFHFGIYYELFNVLVLPHATATRVVHFHNVTPPDLLGGETRAHAQAGLIQLAAASHADAVWSDSPHNTEVLLDWTDVDPARVLLVPPAVPDVGAAPAPDERRSGPIRIITIGRFIEAKGLSDLVAAIALLDETVRSSIDVTLAGSVANSDASFLLQLEDDIDRTGLADIVHIARDLTDDEIVRSLWDADLFVSASHHEGFCVPAIEALATGCRAVVTDAGALPDTVGPGARIVPPSDPTALAGAIAAELTEITLLQSGEAAAVARDEERRVLVTAHLEQFSAPTVARRLLEVTGEALSH